MSNSHIDNLVNAVVNKISAVVNNHNSSSNAHSSLLSDYLQTTDVKDNLTSTDTNKPLSAKQGKELKTLVDGKSDTSHTHSPSQIGSGISSADWKLGYMQGDGSTQEYFNQSVNYEVEDIWSEFSGVYNTFNDFELVALKTDDISQLTSNTEYYPSAKGVADYIDYIIPVTNLSDFNDDLNYITSVDTSSFDSGISVSNMETSSVYSNGNFVSQYNFNRTVNEDIGDLWDSIQNKEDQSNKVTSLSSTSTDTQYPSAKAVYDSLDAKEDESNKVSSWNSTTNNIRYPTEKLVKDSLDGKADNNHTHEVLLSSNDDSDIQLFNVSAQGVPQGEGQSLGAFLSEFWKKIYPVGSIYMSVNSTSPQTLFGGTWEQIQDRFLLASGSTYSAGATGGSADAVNVAHSHTTGRDYIITTDGSGISRVSTAGQTGTKVQNLLQSSDALYRHTVESAGVSGTGKNMPPYLTVYMWKRTA